MCYMYAFLSLSTFRNRVIAWLLITVCYSEKSWTELVFFAYLLFFFPFFLFVQEWGDPRKEEYYYYMKSYSPVDNVSTGI
jgi:hypothetical protein